MRKINKFIIHHSATPKITNWRSINETHKNKWNNKSSLGYYVGYHYIILGNGEVKQFRAIEEEGIHTVGHNHDSVGICLMGDFTIEKPDPVQIFALRDLLKLLSGQYGINNLYGHKELTDTACPGNLDLDFIRGLFINKKSNKEEIINKLKETIRLLEEL